MSKWTFGSWTRVDKALLAFSPQVLIIADEHPERHKRAFLSVNTRLSSSSLVHFFLTTSPLQRVKEQNCGSFYVFLDLGRITKFFPLMKILIQYRTSVL